MHAQIGAASAQTEGESHRSRKAHGALVGVRMKKGSAGSGGGLLGLAVDSGLHANADAAAALDALLLEGGLQPLVLLPDSEHRAILRSPDFTAKDTEFSCVGEEMPGRGPRVPAQAKLAGQLESSWVSTTIALWAL